MEVTPSAGEKALKVKSLLASYYNQNDQEQPENNINDFLTPSKATSSAAGSSPPRSIAESEFHRPASPLDASYFDADVHLGRLIKESRLASLVEQHRALAAEVGALDSDMQTLVYENYNKFIGATDIIRSMDGAMSSMDGQLNHLQQLITQAVSRSETVNGTLEKHQEAITELKETREILRELHLVLDVPKKLKAAIQHGAYDVAADTYADVAPVLKKHGHRKALVKVAAEVENYRTEASTWLRNNLAKNPDSAVETIQLIGRFGESTASLVDSFFDCQRKRLENALKVGEKAVAEMDIGAGLDTLNSSFLPELAKTTDLFTRIFDATSRPKLASETREWFLNYITVVKSGFEVASLTYVAAAVGLKTDGTTTSDETMNNKKIAAFSEDWGAEKLAQALDSLREDLVQLESSLPELSLRDKASEIVGNAVRQHVNYAFMAIEARFLVHLHQYQDNNDSDHAGAGYSTFDTKIVSELINAAVRGLEYAIIGVSQWQSHAWTLEGWHDAFSALVQAHATNYLQSIPQRCLHVAGLVENLPLPAMPAMLPHPPFLSVWNNNNHNENNPMMLLALSAVCSASQPRLLDRAEELLKTLHIGRESVIEASSNASNVLLEAFTQAITNELSELLLASVDSTPWRTLGEPQAPRPICYQLIKKVDQYDSKLQAVEQEASLAFSTKNSSTQSSNQFRGGGGGGVHHRSTSVDSTASNAANTTTINTSSMNANTSIGVVWTSRASVLVSPLQTALHAHATALRKYTLSRSAFQQIQLDCHYLRPHVQRVVQGAPTGSLALAALDEMMVVAAERCGEPVMLEPSLLDRMVK